MLYRTSRPTPTVHHLKGKLTNVKRDRNVRVLAQCLADFSLVRTQQNARSIRGKYYQNKGHAQLLLLPFLDWADRATGDRFK